MELLLDILKNTFSLFYESSVYVLFGLVISGLIRIFLSPNAVAQHLGKGRFTSVFKAAVLGIPLPLCSCGVLPTAVSLKKQGANNGATAAFLISTPESGVDSIAITYALLDPIMTIARPLVAFFSAMTAGLSENFLRKPKEKKSSTPDLSCPVDNCCDGQNCSPEDHRTHHTFFEKIKSGLLYAFTDVWTDMASWFVLGLFLAGMITTFIPPEIIRQYLGGGIYSMLVMLAVGIPLYICATASTPIAAALILKGISPGAALVFLLVGPATNVTSLTVLLGILGKGATAIYLSTIAISAVVFGLALDQVYIALGISAQAVAGQATELIPVWMKWIGSAVLFFMSIKPVSRSIKTQFFIKFLKRYKTSTKSGSQTLTLKPVSCETPNCGCESISPKP